MDDRLPPGLEAAALMRQVASAGGFATVLRKGEPDHGTLLLVLRENGGNLRVFERMPQPDGKRKWQCAKHEVNETTGEIAAYLDRRAVQDPDLWIVELDIAHAERFIG